ncbi:LacI family transcriptional regulator [Rhizocola hellebori]|uniref:LacI family transcriptional regulator n=1 Tax=Rhizocola hellebori TaxID=1392758 RepID=A0A8J3Q3M0_9ACTN|nr:LacI family DNA-binding transcriptional regulator [Rhizocola hellebori]GIH03046.1 LacI family transcriptional regulator [Rhizocola hellebori]
MVPTSGAQPPHAQRSTTIAEIARLAGVSAPTVSKVLNGRTTVAADTREHVLEVLHEHGYRSTRKALKLSSLVELVFHELVGIYPVDILRGVQRIAVEHQVAVVVSESQGSQTPGRGWLEGVLRRRPIGVIPVFSDLSTQQRAQLATAGIPLVVLDPNGVPDDDVPSVGSTNWIGGLSATRHLLELGHRRVAVITGPKWALSSRARLDGYRAALDAAGVPIDPALIREGSFEIADGLTHTNELLRLSDPPTAIFTFNDGMAIGVYHAASLAGLHVPRDLSVVGFDDYQPLDRWLVPPLTTVRQPLAEMGAAAARMVLDLAQGTVPQPKRLELATEMVIRESTAPPARR